MTAPLSEISILWVGAVCKIHTASYGTNTHHNHFPTRHLCVLTLITPKVQVVYEHSTHRTTALLSEMTIFIVRAGWETWLPSYGSKYASECLSDSHLCVLPRITWKLQVIYTHSAYRTTALLSKTFLERSDWRVTAPHTHQSFPDTTLCVYTCCKPVHISLFGAQLRMITKLTYLMTAYYKPNNSFIANNTSLSGM